MVFPYRSTSHAGKVLVVTRSVRRNDTPTVVVGSNDRQRHHSLLYCTMVTCRHIPEKQGLGKPERRFVEDLSPVLL
jgi:hypothetical protein